MVDSTKPSLASFEVHCEKESIQDIDLNECIDKQYEHTDLSKEEEIVPFFPKECRSSGCSNDGKEYAVEGDFGEVWDSCPKKTHTLVEVL